MKIELPYPPQELSPNAGARMNFMKKARIIKQYRELVGWKIKASGMKPTLNLKVTFHPRRSHADKDNAIASFKAGQDGIADAFGMKSDNALVMQYEMGSSIKGGKVVVEAILQKEGVPYLTQTGLFLYTFL